MHNYLKNNNLNLFLFSNNNTQSAEKHKESGGPGRCMLIRTGGQNI